MLLVMRNTQCTTRHPGCGHLLAALTAVLAACGSGAPSKADNGGPPSAWWEDAGPGFGSDAGQLGTGLELEAPGRTLIGVGFPVIVRTADRSPYEGMATVYLGDREVAQLVLYRGRGSARVVIDQPGDHELSAVAGELAGVVATVSEALDSAEATTVLGDLGPGEHTWGAATTIRVDDELTVPVDATLVIEAGALVLVEPATNVIVLGRLLVTGTASEPVLIGPTGNAPWGGIEVRGVAAQADLQHALLTGGGGVGSRAQGHSSSQPVIFADGSAVRLQGGGLIDNPGKAFFGSGSVLRYEDILVSRCDTGGEYTRCAVEIVDSHYVEFPDGDGLAQDDDNDGSYFGSPLVVDGVEQPTTISRSVFAMGEDDGIDHNGGLVVIESSWIAGFKHEGIATSSGRTVTVRGSVISDCQQGIEAGYGSPAVIVEDTVVTGNEVGLRFGDSYAEAPTGSMTVSASVIAFNDQDVLESDDTIDVSGKIELSCSLVSDDSRATGSNQALLPDWDYRSCGDYPSSAECGRLGPALEACLGWQ